MNSCSFSGHRRIPDEHRNRLRELIDEAINDAYAQGCRTFFTGGATGFDTMAARAVILLRIRHPDIRLVLLLPCRDQDALWSEMAKDAYNWILSEADEVRYSSDRYTDRCMRERNFSLASAGDRLICYVSGARSGSAQTRSMADKMGKEIVNLYEKI